LSDIIIFLAYVGLLLGGFASPFVTSMGYLWVDSFYPQYLGRGILGGIPVAAVMGASAVLAYLLMDRKAPPRVGMFLILTGAMLVWMTATLMWAVRPDAAWLKWDFAFKTVVFSAFLPFVFRSRVQIEAMLLAHMLGSGMHLIGVGIKGTLTGGGYQWRLTQLPGDTGLAETSAMATMAIAFIPLLLYMRTHSQLVPFPWIRKTFFTCYALLMIPCMIATGARTGFVCLVVLGGMYWVQSKQKVVSGIAILMMAVLVVIFAPDRWKERMGTIGEFKIETSALTRIKVWEWAIDFAKNNPLGGGFRAYEVNVLHMPPDEYNPEGWIQRGRAPHSTWFELLTEVGWPGTIIFLSLITVTLWSLYRVWKRTRGVEELLWVNDLARALAMALVVLMAGSTFIGIGFKSWYWFLFASAFILSEYLRRVTSPVKPLPGFMPQTPPAAARPTLPGAGPGGGPVRGLAVRRRA
jgi:putative inorganic carbon (HCO3(-)) transporter